MKKINITMYHDKEVREQDSSITMYRLFDVMKDAGFETSGSNLRFEASKDNKTFVIEIEDR